MIEDLQYIITVHNPFTSYAREFYLPESFNNNNNNNEFYSLISLQFSVF